MVGTVGAAHRLLKPHMFIRSVVHHQIHHQPHSPRMDFLRQPVKILHGAELFHDFVIVSDIITIVIVGGIINRRQPQRIHPQIFQIIQFPDHPFQVADPVPIRIRKTSGINLIKNRLLPPFMADFCRRHFLRYVCLAVHEFQKGFPERLIQEFPRKGRHSPQGHSPGQPARNRPLPYPSLKQDFFEYIPSDRMGIHLPQGTLHCDFLYHFPSQFP